jgi:hypothetical protein
MKQTRQPVRAVKQSIYLDVYGLTFLSTNIGCTLKARVLPKNKPVAGLLNI